MSARRNRSAMVLILFAVVLFIISWPLDEYISNPKTWHSQVYKDKFNKDKPRPWRESSTSSTGVSFFSTVFRGGGGTPAIFAMLGGQRYLVANILWNYADWLFHQGKPYDMVQPYESAVTLNPSFYEAWSVYAWHLAFNLFAYTDDFAEKARWLNAGEKVYIRAIQANPDKPYPYQDMGWFYLKRKGNLLKAMKLYQYVVEKGPFEPLTPADEKRREELMYVKWDPRKEAHTLAYIYKQLGVISGEKKYFDKAVQVYDRCLEINPKDKDATRLKNELLTKQNDPKWLADELDSIQKIRANFKLPPLKPHSDPETVFDGNLANIVPDDAQ